MNRYDIVVIGGGVIGASAARVLRMQGRDVCLIERSAPGGESSGAAAGILGALSETDSDLLARLGMRSVRLYRSMITDLVEATGRNIDFWKEGTIRIAFDAEGESALAARVSRADRLGATAIALDRAQLRRLEPDLAAAGDRLTVLFPDEGRVEGRSLCRALIDDFAARGGVVMRHTAVRRVVVEGGRVSGVETPSQAIACDAVVDAAGAWAGGFEGAPDIPVEPVRGQMVCVTLSRPLFRHTIYTDRVYAAARRDGRLLLGSTRERVGFVKLVSAAGVAGILARGFRLSGAIRQAAVTAWWCGLRPCSRDGLPLVGFWPGLDGYLVATGHGRNGVLLAPITAELIADAFDGRVGTDAALLDPGRRIGPSTG